MKWLIAANQGWVNVGVDGDAAAFALESIRRWWFQHGKSRYHTSKRLHITADSGGSNGARVRLWKVELQKLVSETGLENHAYSSVAGHKQMEQDRESSRTDT